MQENSSSESKSYTVPKAVVKKAKQTLIEKAQEDIAKQDLMIAYYQYQATLTEDTKTIGTLGMQADKLEQQRRVNISFLEWIEALA